MIQEMWEYLQEKRVRVLNEIEPIMQAFNIKDYDYVVKQDLQTETLRIGNTYIGCSLNSIDDVENEILKYLIINRDIYLGAFNKQTKNHLKRYWLDDVAKKRNNFI